MLFTQEEIDLLLEVPNNPDRDCYHSRYHIDRLYEHAQTTFYNRIRLCEFPRAVYGFIFFHDVIYKPGQSDNESRSLLFFSEWNKEHKVFDKAEADLIRKGITVSANYLQENPFLVEPSVKGWGAESYLTLETMIMHDLDLYDLAVSFSRMKQNAQKIFHEHVTVGPFSAEEFLKGNKAFLRGMLLKPWIFRSPTLYQENLHAYMYIENQLSSIDHYVKQWSENTNA